ncbi:MAG: hypothetical protein DDT19_01876 [Syntrophomonadaceae bacterium]|nr:hypothetical protein [Bacillota bacterium]
MALVVESRISNLPFSVPDVPLSPGAIQDKLILLQFDVDIIEVMGPGGAMSTCAQVVAPTETAE